LRANNVTPVDHLPPTSAALADYQAPHRENDEGMGFRQMKNTVAADAANNASRQRKPNKSSSQQIALHLCYGQIGISAVAAAARYQSDTKAAAPASTALSWDAYDSATA
jgi:hypothetical protein